MKFNPLHDRILIKRIEEKETAKGGIIIPPARATSLTPGAAGCGPRTPPWW
jgi:co-chaperonin GroES (HSP10)